MKIKTGDQVKVLAGKHRGQTGKVLKVMPKKQAAIVEGMNLVKRHVRPMAGRSGEIKQMAKPLGWNKLRVVESKKAEKAAKADKPAKPAKSTKKSSKTKTAKKSK